MWGQIIGTLAGQALNAYFNRPGAANNRPGFMNAVNRYGNALGQNAPGIYQAIGEGLGNAYDTRGQRAQMEENAALGQAQRGGLNYLNQQYQQAINPDANIMGQLNQQIPGANLAALQQNATNAYRRNIERPLIEQFGGEEGVNSSGFINQLGAAQGDLRTRLAELEENSNLARIGYNQQRLGQLAGYQGAFPGLNLQRLDAYNQYLTGQQGMGLAQQGLGQQQQQLDLNRQQALADLGLRYGNLTELMRNNAQEAISGAGRGGYNNAMAQNARTQQAVNAALSAAGIGTGQQFQPVVNQGSAGIMPHLLSAAAKIGAAALV